MEWTVHPYVEVTKVYAVSIPLQFRLKVMRIRGASVGITKRVLSTESEKYHNVLHVHDRGKCINMLTLGSSIRFMTMLICFLDLENPGIDALFI